MKDTDVSVLLIVVPDVLVAVVVVQTIVFEFGQISALWPDRPLLCHPKMFCDNIEKYELQVFWKFNKSFYNIGLSRRIWPI